MNFLEQKEKEKMEQFTLRTLPSWLKNGDIYENLLEGADLDSPIDSSLYDNIVKSTQIYNFNSFKRVFNASEFWMLKEYPLSLIIYALINKSEVLPFLENKNIYFYEGVLYNFVFYEDRKDLQKHISSIVMSNTEHKKVMEILDSQVTFPKKIDLNKLKIVNIPLCLTSYTEKLLYLDLSNNKIEDISIINSLINLIKLCLRHNQIEQIPLLTLEYIEELYLDNNKIKNTDNLRNLTTLEDVDLSSNKIENPTGFNNLSNLRVLNLSNNKIKNAENLQYLVQSLPKVEFLWLDFNPIDYDTLENFISQFGREIGFY
jgi:hypothetical protein